MTYLTGVAQNWFKVDLNQKDQNIFQDLFQDMYALAMTIDHHYWEYDCEHYCAR